MGDLVKVRRQTDTGLACFTMVLLLFLLLQSSISCGSATAEKFIMNGGYIVENNGGTMKYREQELFVPASTLKILTSLVTLEKLGQRYRFKTHFFLDDQKNLYIKGYGDPFLTSEVIFTIGKKLSELGIDKIGTFFLDDSAFALNGETASIENSENPYDAPNGALAVNFNALPVLVKRNGNVSSGESQTPLIPLMTEAGLSLPPGHHRINVDTLSRNGQLPPSLRYAAELFISQFRLAGISMQGSYKKVKVPKGLRPVYIHYGEKSLEEIIKACLKNSNNYIANQLFLVCGAQSFGLPATWDKSRKTFALYVEEHLQLNPDQIYVKEGSGLSRQNRISPSALIAILDHFKPYSRLLKRKRDILLKSGTMKDVYCYAGYFPQDNGLTSFAILLNQTNNNREKVLRALYSALPRQASPEIHQ